MKDNNSQNNDPNNRDLADITIDAVENVVNTTNHISEHNKQDVNRFKTKAALCYFPLVAVYYIIKNQHKNNEYMLFHVNQGMIITCFWIAVVIFTSLTSTIFRVDGLFVSYVPTAINLVNYILYCLAIVLSGFGFINTINGNSKELPVIGKLKIIK